MWRGLLLAAFMNTQSEFYYRMLSNFMGQGDKETFPFALLATNASFHLITTPVGSVGLQKCAFRAVRPMECLCKHFWCFRLKLNV